MNIKDELKWLPVIALLTFIVFANSLTGTFVYDDRRQIEANALIQDPGLIGKALTSDVWAFKGDGSVAASNYWRPTFTAWSIINFKLFGQSPFGWHLLNILLHIGVCLIAFLLLRRWGISQWLAFGITLIYAVHPVHSESVAWIAGSPDLLFGLFFLGSLWFAESAREEKGRPLNIALAVVFYLLALGAKEIAFLCLPIFYFIFARSDGEEKGSGIPMLTPFAIAAAGWFFVRWLILGSLSRPAEEATSTINAVLSVPAAFVFYLKQIFFPYWLSVNYGLRPVEQVGAANFVLPLIVSLAVIVAIWFLARRSFVQMIGAALFLLPLVLSFNIGAFPYDQIVHDRYLYLPLLGFLMFVVPFLHDLAKRFAGEKAEMAIAGLLIALSILLAVRTYTYNETWLNELALWQNAVAVDTNSASNWSQLAAVYEELGKVDEGLNARERSLAVKETPIALLGKGRGLTAKNRFDEAIPIFKKVVETDTANINAYTLYQGYESLAVALQGKNDLPEAEKTLRRGIEQLPIYRASLTEKLAVILYLQNRKADALKELEAVKDQARTELLPASKGVFLRLGMLYGELQRTPEARANLQEFLAATHATRDRVQLDERKMAEDLLKRLR